MTDYYDVVLGLIPLSVAGIAAVLVAIGVTATLAVSAGALSASVLIGHAMFVRAPVTTESSSGVSRPTEAGTTARTEQSPVNAAD